MTIWYKIVLPLSKPVLATVMLWIAVAHWNNYFDAMIYMHDRSTYTLPVVLRRILLENELDKYLPEGASDTGTAPQTPETTKGAIVMVLSLIHIYQSGAAGFNAGKSQGRRYYGAFETSGGGGDHAKRTDCAVQRRQ